MFRKDLVMTRNKQNAEEVLLGHGAPKQRKGAPTHIDQKKETDKGYKESGTTTDYTSATGRGRWEQRDKAQIGNRKIRHQNYPGDTSPLRLRDVACHWQGLGDGHEQPAAGQVQSQSSGSAVGQYQEELFLWGR